jgi:hypothetical protein
MLFVNPDCLNKKDAKVLKAQIEQQAKERRMLEADYENRLKADMVAMLEDLRLDFQEAELAGVLDNKELIFADEVDDLVQQKINELKAESEDKK